MFPGGVSFQWGGALALASAVAGLALGDEAGDWRLELLAEERLSSETEALEKMREGFEVSEEGVAKAVGQLGAEAFAAREEAARELLMMGKEILPTLRQLPRSKDPEVRMRLAEIERSLQANGRWGREDLLRQAVMSLLKERLPEKEGQPVEEVFAEFFETAAPKLAGPYRKFHFEADEGMVGLVSDGVLRMKGNHGGDGDQRLLLSAKELTGKEEFPDAFRIEVKLCGEEGGGGAFHIGVSVGNVRALIHPNYAGGGFRFEKVDTNRELSTTTEMGFDPPTGKFLLMSVEVKRLPSGLVEMIVSLNGPEGGEPFERRQIFMPTVIGKLDHIGLDRSGRTGGDALFDDLVVELQGQ